LTGENDPEVTCEEIEPAITKPEITKNTSTPTKPPGMIPPAWKSITSNIAIARNP
jgi:hypothetical protein